MRTGNWFGSSFSKRFADSEQGIAIVMIVVAVLFGAAVRIGYLTRTDFPINDGGMFYTMIRDLQANHYALPAYTSYNQANIPYA